MLDHVSVNVRDLARSRAFFEDALAPLGYAVAMEIEGGGVGFAGPEGHPDFWIVPREPTGGSTHVAFRAADRDTVDRFHRAAVAAGGEDNGPPGPRPHYHEHYYGAFVHDPDGNNVEAVCHTPR
jgi:catechol 2,3-dioxygenase-like lactoylglutathione lyase family enzyme